MNNFSFDFVQEQVSEANKNLLPQKSKDTYQDVWTKYEKFCSEKKIKKENDINSVYAYLNWMHTEKEWKSPSTLWNKYSILKSMVFNKYGVIFDNDPIEKQITLWIKQKQVTFKIKQSEMFTKDEVCEFVEKGEFELIQTKIVLLIGCFTGLRSESITKLAWNNFVFLNNLIKVYINFETKTDKRGEGMWFLFPENFGNYNLILKIFENYYDFLKEKNVKYIAGEERILPRIDFKNIPTIYKKAYRGKSWIADVPKTVAIWHNKLNSEKFTGHCLRRTCAQWLADSGMAEIEIMHFFGWKNCNMVKVYTKNSESTKKKAAKSLEFKNNEEKQKEKNRYELEEEKRFIDTKKIEEISLKSKKQENNQINNVFNASNVIVVNSPNKSFFKNIHFFKKNKQKFKVKKIREKNSNIEIKNEVVKENDSQYLNKTKENLIMKDKKIKKNIKNEYVEKGIDLKFEIDKLKFENEKTNFQIEKIKFEKERNKLENLKTKLKKYTKKKKENKSKI